LLIFDQCITNQIVNFVVWGDGGDKDIRIQENLILYPPFRRYNTVMAREDVRFFILCPCVTTSSKTKGCEGDVLKGLDKVFLRRRSKDLNKSTGERYGL